MRYKASVTCSIRRGATTDAHRRRSTPSSSQPPIKADDQLLNQQHRDHDHDQGDDAMERPLEADVLTERKGQGLEDHEFRPEEDQPRTEKAKKDHEAARLGFEIAPYAMLNPDRHFQQSLQQNGGKQCYCERVADVHSTGIF